MTLTSHEALIMIYAFSAGLSLASLVAAFAFYKIGGVITSLNTSLQLKTKEEK